MVYSSRSIQNMRKHLVGIQATPPPKKKPFENWPILEPKILTNQKFHGSYPPWNWELAPEKWNAGRDDSFLQVQKAENIGCDIFVLGSRLKWLIASEAHVRGIFLS